MGFWTLGSLVGNKRDLVELKSIREEFETSLRLKIGSWKIAEEEIAKLDIQIAELEAKIN